MSGPLYIMNSNNKTNVYLTGKTQNYIFLKVKHNIKIVYNHVVKTNLNFKLQTSVNQSKVNLHTSYLLNNNPCI